MFASYESEFRTIVGGVPQRVEQVASYESDSRARRNLLKQIEVDLGQADSLLRQMEVEARSDPTKPVLWPCVEFSHDSPSECRHECRH